MIAEAGSNHDGSLDRAKDLIRIAADSGADAVKFQLFRAEALYPRTCGTVDLPSGPADLFSVLSELEMPDAWLPALAQEARANAVALIVTPFDEHAVDVVAATGVAAIKIASPELTDLPLLRRAARTGLPLVLSTGMASLGDIEEALTAIAARGGTTGAVLQCTTSYPCPEGDANVSVVRTLHEAFGLPSGLSDHTLEPVAAAAVAVSFGACVIEKHFTDSRRRPGPDHSFAVEPGELRSMVDTVHALDVLPVETRATHVAALLGRERFERLAGRPAKQVAASEAELARTDRRTIRFRRDRRQGDVLGPDDIAILRGERNLEPGLHPRHVPVVVGARLRRDRSEGDPITWEDLVEKPRP